MKSNIPPGAADDPDAPYNEKTKIVTVNISQCLSTTVNIELPEDADETDSLILEQAVRDQVMLPSDCLENEGYWWGVDEFWVGL